MNIAPDEGCCLAVLHTAGRHGLKDLALDVIRELKSIGVVWKEYHFAPLVETFCKAGDIREAFATLSLMRQSDVEPTLETAYPIFQVISTSDEKVDEAWGIVEDLKKEGRQVDVVAYNTLIQSCVAIGDLQRALGTYKAAKELEVKPDVETYNLLLSACIAAEHRELGDRLLKEMREASLRPNERTYERLIVLCLTQAMYEDAFYYLEEMKSIKLKPPQAVYEAIIRKCVFVGDSRYKIAVDEMMETGYVMSQRLQEYIDNGGQPASHKDQKRRSR
jgi:pentatricopeptide repeat protein